MAASPAASAPKSQRRGPARCLGAELWRPGVGYLPAFADCMKGFIEAIDKGVEAPTSGRDNLKTLELLFAAHRSIETRQTVAVGNG